MILCSGISSDRKWNWNLINSLWTGNSTLFLTSFGKKLDSILNSITWFSSPLKYRLGLIFYWGTGCHISADIRNNTSEILNYDRNLTIFSVASIISCIEKKLLYRTFYTLYSYYFCQMIKNSYVINRLDYVEWNHIKIIQ